MMRRSLVFLLWYIVFLTSVEKQKMVKMADVDVFMFKPGPSLIGVLKKDWASPNSIALSWQQPEQTTLPVLDYEIKYYEKVQLLPLL